MKTAEQILDDHCTTVYSRNTGEEEIEASKSSVIIAMEEYARQEIKLPNSTDIEQKFKTRDPNNTGFVYGSPNNKHCQEGANWAIEWIKENN